MREPLSSNDYPTVENEHYGFRIALVPEPASLSLLALGGLLIARCRRGQHFLAVILLATGVLAGKADLSAANVLNMGSGLTSLETVPVGAAGNAADARHATPGYGAVSYDYRIGKYEVTAGQYCEFLNAVARTDAYGLYNVNMSNPVSALGCNIQRSGSSGGYTYSVAADWANRPVNYVSFWDSCRFANWLHNGQPEGLQDAATTESGAYALTSEGIASNAVVRSDHWRWAVTSEDEWYKAAYYNPTVGGYYSYPTSSNSAPGRDMNESTQPGNNANYNNGTYLIGSPYYRTLAGEFELSASPWGTFDQGGNVEEWNEAVVYSSNRGMRGGTFYYGTGLLDASYRPWRSATVESAFGGFRVVQVPEPASLCLLALGGLLLARRRA